MMNMIASTTQIKPATLKGCFLLLYHIFRVRQQLKSAPGLIKMDFNREWRTLTVWKTAEDMKAFRNRGAHLNAMKYTAKIGKAYTTTWEVDRFPTWPEAIEKLNATTKPK